MPNFFVTVVFNFTIGIELAGPGLQWSIVLGIHIYILYIYINYWPGEILSTTDRTRSNPRPWGHREKNLGLLCLCAADKRDHLP